MTAPPRSPAVWVRGFALAAARSKAVRGALLAVVAVTVALWFVPAFGTLDYYFALAASAVLGPTGLTIGLTVARAEGASVRRRPALLAALGTTGTLSVVALALMLVNGLRQPLCDVASGVLWFFVGPVAGALYATVFGFAVGLLCPSRALRVVCLVALVALAVVCPVVTLYTTPAIHFYHPVFGYFSGAVYDELIEIDRVLLVYRLTNLLEAATLVLLLDLWPIDMPALWQRDRRRFVVLATGIVAVCVCLVLPAPLGYRHSHRAIQAALGGHLRTPHFDIYYAAGTPYEGVVSRVASEHERCYARITAALGRAPAGHTASYIFPNLATKRRLMGADRVYVSKPWLREVYLGPVAVDDTVICHELVHALAAECAPGPLHVPARWAVLPHMGLVEGLAKALEGDTSVLSRHRASAAMRALGFAPDMRRLLGPDGFWTAPAGQAYTTAGSFLQFLSDTRGTGRLCALYDAGDFDAVYGVSADVLITDWEAFLDANVRPTVTELEFALTRDVFDRPSLFQKVCPLETARVERAAGEARRLRRFADAARLLGHNAATDPERPARRLVYAQALLSADAAAAAASWFDSVAADSRSSRPLAHRARLGLADAAWLSGREDDARQIVGALDGELLAPDLRRAVAIRDHALSVADGPTRALLADVLLRPLPPGVVAFRLRRHFESVHRDPVIAYLWGSIQLFSGQPEASLRAFAAASGGPPALAAERDRRQAVALFLAGQLPAAAAAFAALGPAESEWQDRVRFWQAHPGGIPAASPP